VHDCMVVEVLLIIYRRGIMEKILQGDDQNK
jgi:hypothetical protein